MSRFGTPFLVGAVFLSTHATPAAEGIRAEMGMAVTAAGIIEVDPRLELLGSVEPVRFCRVPALTDGQIVSSELTVGRVVRQGERLAQLDDEALELRLQEAKLAVAKTQARLQQVEIEIKNLEGAVSDGAVAEHQVHAAALTRDIVRFDSKLAELTVRAAEHELAKSRIIAPIDGIIVDQHYQIGEWVAQGETLVTIVDFSEIDVNVSVPAGSVKHVKEGAPAELSIDAAIDTPMRGQVTYVSRVADPETGTVEVRVTVSMPEELVVRSGLSARVVLQTGPRSKVVAVMKEAVRRGAPPFERAHFVVVVRDDGSLERRLVEIGDEREGLIEITEGLQPGEHVVLPRKNGS